MYEKYPAYVIWAKKPSIFRVLVEIPGYVYANSSERSSALLH